MRDDVSKIYEQARRATIVVQNLLSFARKHEPERKCLDIATAIEKSVALKAYNFSSSNIHVTLDVDQNLPRVLADEHQLQQVFLNIIVNAEHAALASRGYGNFHIAAHKLGDNVRISFADDGRGIPDNLRGRIFDPFFTRRCGRGHRSGAQHMLRHNQGAWRKTSGWRVSRLKEDTYRVEPSQ